MHDPCVAGQTHALVVQVASPLGPPQEAELHVPLGLELLPFDAHHVQRVLVREPQIRALLCARQHSLGETVRPPRVEVDHEDAGVEVIRHVPKRRVRQVREHHVARGRDRTAVQIEASQVRDVAANQDVGVQVQGAFNVRRQQPRRQEPRICSSAQISGGSKPLGQLCLHVDPAHHVWGAGPLGNPSDPRPGIRADSVGQDVDGRSRNGIEMLQE
jgi:hypothetical protein